MVKTLKLFGQMMYELLIDIINHKKVLIAKKGTKAECIDDTNHLPVILLKTDK